MYEIGIIGLGRMGYGIAEKMLNSKKVKVHAYNRGEEPRKKLAKKGAKTYPKIKTMIDSMQKKIVWLMLPNKITPKIFEETLSYLQKGDIIIDGSNSHFELAKQKAQQAQKKGVKFLDIGVSGGIIARKTGYPLMIGGDKSAYNQIKPILKTFAYPQGFEYFGEAGSGHYVKMIHNAIEYGMMQSIAEGFEILEKSNFELDLKKVSKLYTKGTIVSGLLMDVTHNAIKSGLKYKPFVEDSGEGKWAAKEALDLGVPFISNTYALHARYHSRNKDSYAFKLLAGMRKEFGGHSVKK
ncbi:MAG: phosphogluconate dehydrogenase (NAD(+)-dependent, decarboxylating) [Candidatus Woesearchaeota archaeon]